MGKSFLVRPSQEQFNNLQTHDLTCKKLSLEESAPGSLTMKQTFD